MTKHVLEVVEFKLNKDVAKTDFLDAVDSSQAFVSSLDGFIDRHTAQTSDGLWVDVVKWQDMDAAQTAAKAFQTAEEIVPFVSLIDHGSIKMQHFAIENVM